MAFFFENPQRRVLPAIEALQQLHENPNRLASERDQRYNEPPPPYSESGDTTQPPTPGSPVVDEFEKRRLRVAAHGKSMPVVQFKSQAKRECERLLHQSSKERSGRRQTLPWDMSLDLQANSENNVRCRWVQQGIWGEEWGPAWPKKSEPLSLKWRMGYKGNGPFQGLYNITTSKSFPGGRWGHEESDPEAESDTEQEREQEQEREAPPLFGVSVRQPERPKSPQPIRYISGPFGPIPQYPIPRPTVHNPEASRPYQQFLSQISQEREWVKDEINFKSPGSVIDLDAIAYESVKENWIKDGVWRAEWDELPGMTWIHEEHLEEETVEAPLASDRVSEQLPDTADNDRQQSCGSRYPALFGPATTNPEGTNGHTIDSPAPLGAETERQTRGKNSKTSAGPSAVTDDAQDPKAPPRRSLRSGMRVHSPVHGGSSTEPMTSTRAGMKVPLTRSQRDEPGQSSIAQKLDITEDPSASDCDAPSSTRQRKRNRSSDAVEDQQPPKRTRYNTRGADLSRRKASNATARAFHSSKDIVTSEGRTLHGDEETELAHEETRMTRDGPSSIPLRRSARIAGRERGRHRSRAAGATVEAITDKDYRGKPLKTRRSGLRVKALKKGRRK